MRKNHVFSELVSTVTCLEPWSVGDFVIRWWWLFVCFLQNVKVLDISTAVGNNF